MPDTQPHPAEYLPRDEQGRFVEGHERCQNCHGTGTDTTVVGDPNAPEDAEGWDATRSVKIWCPWCDGRGSNHTEGCPRCGSDDIRDSSTPGPSIGRVQSCRDCPWSWDYA